MSWQYKIDNSPILLGWRILLSQDPSKFSYVEVKTLLPVSVVRQLTCRAFSLGRTHAALRDVLPALWARGHVKTPPQDHWQIVLYPPAPPPSAPFYPHRFEESAVQASRRRAEERQETLWWSEPAADGERRSGCVKRDQCMCRWGGFKDGEDMRERETGGSMQSEGWYVKDDQRSKHTGWYICKYIYIIHKNTCSFMSVLQQQLFTMKDADMCGTVF